MGPAGQAEREDGGATSSGQALLARATPRRIALPERGVELPPLEQGNRVIEPHETDFRLCFAMSHERLEEALRRIGRYLDRHHDGLRATAAGDRS